MIVVSVTVHTSNCCNMGNNHGTPELREEDVRSLQEASGKSEEEIREFFAKFLEDYPDGKIQAGGFKHIMENILPNKSHDKLEQHVFKVYDVNGDGVIDFTEFMTVFFIMSDGSPEEVLAKIFKMIDFDGSGEVSVVEVTRLVTAVFCLLEAEDPGLASQQFVAQSTFFECDDNGDGRVTQEEFIQSCLAREDFTNILTSKLVDLFIEIEESVAEEASQAEEPSQAGQQQEQEQAGERRSTARGQAARRCCVIV